MSERDGVAANPQQEPMWAALQRRDAILQAVSYAAERFLGSEPVESVLTDVLERLGKAAEADSATVLEFVDDPQSVPRLVPRYSWTTAGAESVFDYAADGFPYRGTDFEHLYARLEGGHPIVARIGDLPAGLQAALSSEVRTLAALPIFSAGKLVGIISMSKRWVEREWPDSELGALKTAATVIGAALERNQTRRAVRKRDELLRLIVDNAPLMLAYYDRRMRCRFSNRRYAEFFGFADGALIGNSLDEVMGAEAFRIALPYWKRAYAGEQVVFERPQTGRNGAEQHLEVRIVPHQTESGEIAGCYAILSDITERKRNEEALLEAHDHLEEKVRERTKELAILNRELEAFSYSVSHDLRAPLRAIDGFTHLLAEQLTGKMDSETEGYVSRIRTSVQRMFWLIEDLLELGRVSRKEINATEVDLSLFASEIMEDLTAQDASRQVEWRIEDGLRARGDRQLLRLLLQNLLENAWKYSAKKKAARIEFGAVADANGKRIFHVRDNGAGFDMAHAGKLFQPFQRLHNPRDFEGTGVGLATVARIVQRHGGDIRAEGSVNQGATFWFSLSS